MNEVLRKKLLELREHDARVREELAATGELFDGYCPKMEAVHLENAAALEQMITENGGWFGKSTVGEDGADAAWIIVQHAISRPDLQRKMLPVLQAEAERGEIPRSHAAYLEDRILHFEGKPQIYGTQFDWNADGKMEVWTLEDAEKVNNYRAEVGLEPLENLIWENEETRANRPEDFQKRRAEYEAWARRVGWRK